MTISSDDASSTCSSSSFSATCSSAAAAVCSSSFCFCECVRNKERFSEWVLFSKERREREHELPCLSLERTRKRYIRKNKVREHSFPSLASHDTNTNEHKDANERKALSSVHGRARARNVKERERERERDDFDCVSRVDGSLYYTTLKLFPTLSLSLFLSSKILVRYLIRCFFALCARREPFGQST